MSKILIIGVSPLPIDSSTTLYGLGHRTWHFTEPLLKDGHQVVLITVRIPSAKDVGLNLDKVIKQENKNFIYYCINEPELFQNIQFHQEIHDHFAPDCIIGVNGYPASFGARIKSDKPYWSDLNGALMTEAQAKSYVNGNNEPVKQFWEQELFCLYRSDKFSTVSEPQQYMLLGELATIGRLNQYTIGYDFVCPIRNSIENKFMENKNRQLIRGKIAGRDNYLVLWSGGYNTWTDIDTLYTGLIRSMEINPAIRFISTGGILPGHDEITYQRFMDKIQNSPFRDRFHLLGWVPNNDVFDYYFESDLGINIDSMNYETLTGARNRLIHMMKTGLPVLTSLGTEISHIIRKENIGLTFPIGNALELTNQILYAAEHREQLQAIGQRGKDFIYKNYIYEKTIQPVRDWVNNPQPAPDKKYRNYSNQFLSNPNIHSGQPIWDMLNYFKNLFAAK